MSEEKKKKKEVYNVVSVIGTAGRTNTNLLSKQLYDNMYVTLTKLLKTFNGSKLLLKSGGAAWADHLAVDYYLHHNHDPCIDLHLYFPCPFTNGQFLDNGMNNWKQNPGRSANRYHHRFSKMINRDSLKSIQLAIDQGASVTVRKGFHARNSDVAVCNYLIAFTWDENEDEDQGLSGGSGDTWRKCKTERVHIPLSFIYPPAEIDFDGTNLVVTK